jgi:flagellar hook-associated protein 1
VLEERLDQQQQLASASSARLTALNSVQALFTPDSGSASATAGDIGSDITGFFNSFSSLEANPTDNALRQQVLSSASTLAGDVSNAAASLNEQRSALDQEASGVTSQVNSLTGAIAQLNLQIQSTSPNADAGILEDDRQQDLSKLSQLIGINQITTENNGLSITTTSGQLLVSEGSSFQLTTGSVGGVTQFYLGTSNLTAQLASGGGELGGYLTARDQNIPSVMGSLDQLAYSVSTNVNALNNTGTDLNGVTGTTANPLYIFNQPTGVAGSAANMSVTMTDPNQIAAAGLGQGTGDNSNAIAMANLANRSLMLPSATTAFSMTQTLDATTPLGGATTGTVKVYDSLGNGYNATVTYTNEGGNAWAYSVSMPDAGQTPTDYYSNFVSTLGSTVSSVQTENTAQNASVTQLQTQNNALSSVNLNDEASSMTTLERSYQAASQVFTMLNTIMASALNLGEQTTVRKAPTLGKGTKLDSSLRGERTSRKDRREMSGHGRFDSWRNRMRVDPNYVTNLVGSLDQARRASSS